MTATSTHLAAPRDNPAATGLMIESSSILALDGVTKRFGQITALENFGVDIRKGEFITVIGPSGCGKSTLFNIVAGLESPDEGRISHHGKPVAAGDLLGQVAFMPQQDLLLPWRTVLDNAILAIELEGTPRSEARRMAMDMLPEFGLTGFERHYPQQLSGGMRQRVALMRTFLFKRELMLLDEPFGALDSLTRSMMQRWLLEIWRHHERTVLFITHDIDEAIFLGDRVLVMSARPGRIKLEQHIGLPRPRLGEVVTSEAFVQLKRKLLKELEEESMKSFTP
ncbi:ABC transporter ATP-binding protein [Halomonas salipaludis]|nr:ABC transporter ATP-binding protein [Halomonas salipaludis]